MGNLVNNWMKGRGRLREIGIIISTKKRRVVIKNIYSP